MWLGGVAIEVGRNRAVLVPVLVPIPFPVLAGFPASVVTPGDIHAGVLVMVRIRPVIMVVIMAMFLVVAVVVCFTMHGFGLRRHGCSRRNRYDGGRDVAEEDRCRDEPARRTGSSTRKRRPDRQTAREAGKEATGGLWKTRLTEMI